MKISDIKICAKKVKGDIVSTYKKLKNTINQHIWLELLFMVVLSLVVSSIVFLIVSHLIYSTDLAKREHITYDESRMYIQDVLIEKVAQINEIAAQNYEENQVKEYVINIIESMYHLDTSYVTYEHIYLVDGTGKIMYQDEIVESLNLIKVIQMANNNEYDSQQDKFIAIYPVIINNKVCYLYNESILEAFIYKEFTDVGNILAMITAIGVFILIIFKLTKSKIAYLEYLSMCLEQISTGNLDYKIEIIGQDELAQVARSITHMENELKHQMDARMKIEKSKNELVTNIAHDLRTPLTSIIGYIGLIKEKRYHTQEEAYKYLEISYNKAQKLKVIIEDLFELTKLHQEGVRLKKESMSLSNLLNQLIEELIPLAQEKKIDIETYIDTDYTNVNVDIAKITRVFENLIENAIKYSPEGATIYVELKSSGEYIHVMISNPTEMIIQDEIDRFFDRFYRADQSRNSNAGGSGLGLAIAKNIVELHGGRIKASLEQDLICFKVTLVKDKSNEIKEE